MRIAKTGCVRIVLKAFHLLGVILLWGFGLGGVRI